MAAHSLMRNSEGLSPWYEADVENRHFRVSTDKQPPSRPFWFSPPTGCDERTFDSSCGGEGSLSAYKNVHRGSQNVCLPAIRSLLSVAKFLPLNKWMGILIKKSYTIQFASAPPPFNGVLESVMSSQSESAALTTELKELMEKGEFPEYQQQGKQGFLFTLNSLCRRKQAVWG